MTRRIRDQLSPASGSSVRSDPTTSLKRRVVSIGGAKPKRGWSLAICLFLALAVWAVFGQTRHHEFASFDDVAYVTANRHVTSGLTWEGLIWAFTNLERGFWHPITWLSHMLDCQLYGLNAGGHHCTNVLLHMATAIFLFLALREQTGALWRSAIVAGLFGVHPLHVESVAWVAERKDVLSGLFFMLTIWAYGRYTCQSQAGSPRSKVWYGLALGCFTCGLMSKAMLVTLPLVLLLLDYWPLSRFAAHNFKGAILRLGWEKLPFGGLALTTGLLTIHAENSIGALPNTTAYPLQFRAANAALSSIRYLLQTIWPTHLAVFYPYPQTFFVKSVVVSLLLLALISFAVLVIHRRYPYLAVGWFWYLITLVPVSGLIQIGSHSRADRYTYIPLVGIFLMTVWGVVDLCGRWRHRRVGLAIVAGAILAGLLVAARVQTSFWKDSVSLWTHTLACTSGNALAHNNLAYTLIQQGRLTDAKQHLERALQLNPDNCSAHVNLAHVLIVQGQCDEAIRHCERALQLKPDYWLALSTLGNALATQGRLNEAIQQYERVLQLKPDDVDAHNNLGKVLNNQGKFAEALPHFQQALQLATALHNPTLAEAIRNQLKSYPPVVPQPQTP